jgi:hypothetical protein
LEWREWDDEVAVQSQDNDQNGTSTGDLQIETAQTSNYNIQDNQNETNVSFLLDIESNDNHSSNETIQINKERTLNETNNNNLSVLESNNNQNQSPINPIQDLELYFNDNQYDVVDLLDVEMLVNHEKNNQLQKHNQQLSSQTKRIAGRQDLTANALEFTFSEEIQTITKSVLIRNKERTLQNQITTRKTLKKITKNLPISIKNSIKTQKESEYETENRINKLRESIVDNEISFMEIFGSDSEF